jgi:hypothetical protein
LPTNSSTCVSQCPFNPNTVIVSLEEVPISFLMIIPIFILAFSTSTRALTWVIYKYLWVATVTLVKTAMYSTWLRMQLRIGAALDSRVNWTEKRKNQVRAQRAQLQRYQRRKQDEQWQMAHGISPALASANTFRSTHASTALETHGMARLPRGAPLETV